LISEYKPSTGSVKAPSKSGSDSTGSPGDDYMTICKFHINTLDGR